VDQVIVSSPHCLHVMKADYANEIRIMRFTIRNYCLRLIADGKVTPSKEVDRKVTTTIRVISGRHSGEYEARGRFYALSGTRDSRDARNRENSLWLWRWCGGLGCTCD